MLIGNKRITIVNKLRFTLVLTLSLLIIISLLTLLYGHIVEGSPLKNTSIYIVHDKDTLWGIANKININDLDVREVLFQIKKLNNIKDDFIYEGQKIIIPQY